MVGDFPPIVNVTVSLYSNKCKNTQYNMYAKKHNT